MIKKSFNKGMSKLMKRGYSRQGAFNAMKGLATKNRLRYYKLKKEPQWLRYSFAFLIELFLFAYRVPSKEDTQIMIIQTIIPLSEATRPLSIFVTLLAIILQLISLALIYDLLIKMVKKLKGYFM